MNLVRIDSMGTYVNLDQVESLRSIEPRDGNPYGLPEYELKLINGELYYVENEYDALIEKYLTG